MWPNSRGFAFNQINANANQSQQSSNQISSKTMSSVDPNQLLMAANSLRTLFGDNVSQNLMQTIRDNQTVNTSSDHSLGQIQTQRPPERHVIDYESPHFSRLDRNLLSQMPSNNQRFDGSSNLRTETNHFYDPTKVPQKSILKKSKDNNQPFENTSFHTIEDEDSYLYGSGSAQTMPMSGYTGGLPPGIIQREDQTERSNVGIERVLSPISLRLKREMENMDRTRNSTDRKADTHWTPDIRMKGDEQLVRKNEWEDESDSYRNKYQQLMNPSSAPEDDLELERIRIQQIAAIEAGILSSDKRSLKSQLSPKSRSTRRISSPESTPKRIRRRSPSRSPPPRRRSISPRRRSLSPRNKRRRSRSRSRSRGRGRSRTPERRRVRTPDRRRSRTPERRRTSHSPNRLDMNPMQNLMNPMNPMAGIIPIHPNMPYMGPQIISGPFGPILPNFPHLMTQNIIQNLPKQPNRQMSNLISVPMEKTGPQPYIRKGTEKKEDKLLNPHDLLIAERAKLRDESNELKKEYEKKMDEQKLIVAKDGGTDSYAYRTLGKILKDIRDQMDVIHKNLTKNSQNINEIQRSKTKAKEFVEKLKTTGDINKVELKKPTTDWPSNTPKKSSVSTPSKPSQKKKEEEKEEKKVITIEDDEEEDEKNSRLRYFDCGPHWCKNCDKFTDNVKEYFDHIHTREHLNKHKESVRMPWITKDYIKQMEKKPVNAKNPIVSASKGIHFIHPTQGFYCELCKEFLNDSYQAEKHFKTAKHNRSYTRYTFLHNDYEHKWKTERDKSFMELKKRERELEKENSKKEFDRKVEDRKKLEEEVKRKDKEVKERIEAMNKSLKSVKELDETNATEEKKSDKTVVSPKIRLNLSLNKNESKDSEKPKDKPKDSEKTIDKSKDKPKESDKSKDKSRDSEKIVEKLKDKPKELEKPKEKPKDSEKQNPKPEKSKDKGIEKEIKSKDSKGKLDKIDSQNSEDIDDMLIIDEINCDSREAMQTKDTEIIDENTLLYPEVCDSEPNMVAIEENEKTDAEMMALDDNTSGSQTVENNCIISENKTESEQNSEVEGVMPSTDQTSDKEISDKMKEDIENKGLKEVPIHSSDGTVDNKTSDVCANTPDTCSGIVGNQSDANQQKSDIIETAIEELITNMKTESSDGVEEKMSPHLVSKSGANLLDSLDMDADIARLHQRFESLVKSESVDPEANDEDELDGFDVIDSVNENNEDVIDLSSD